VSNSFIEELVDQGEELKRRSSLEVHADARTPPVSSHRPAAAPTARSAAPSTGSVTASGDLSALLGSVGLPDNEDDEDVAAVLAADSDGEDGDELMFGASSSSRKRIKAKWGLYGDEDDEGDLLLGGGGGGGGGGSGSISGVDGSDSDRHALIENLGAGLGSEMHLRARNKSLVSRVRMLEKDLAAAKAEIAHLKQSAVAAVAAATTQLMPDPKCVIRGSNEDESSSSIRGARDSTTYITADAAPPRPSRHARHTSMPDPFGIDDDVVEKPIDVSTGRSSSLSSRSSSFGQQSNNNGGNGDADKNNQKSGRDMLLSDSPVRGCTGAVGGGGDGSDDGDGDDGDDGDGGSGGNANRVLARTSSANLFEEIDRDAEEERRLLEEALGSNGGDGEANGDDVGSDKTRVEDAGGDHGSTIVEAPSDTYHSSEAKRSRGYRRFLDNFRKRQAADLLTDIKRFVTSVLMPQKNVYGNGGGGRQNDALEDRATQWFAYMDTRFRNHSIWEEASEEELEMARGECFKEACCCCLWS
jgi:hypothetical protein